MKRFIISLILVFSCNSVLALETEEAKYFGDNFITALQNGESVDFIPDRFHADTFLYNTFGEEYLNLTSIEQKKAQTHLTNSLKILHSSPVLVMGYKRMDFFNSQIQSVNNDYIYSYISQIPGDSTREGGIYLMEIQGKIWITDIKSPNGWLTDFFRESYQDMKEEISIIELMELMEYKFKREFDI